MNPRSIVLLLIISLPAFSQTQPEIDVQVWKPFIETFNNHQSKEFLALHSKEVVRSPRDAKQVWNWDKYLQETIEGDKRDVAENRKRTLELRFTERIHSTSQAIDVGVYKTTYHLPDNKVLSYYGRFHVVLRKEANQWKILVDTDSSEGGTIGEKEFLAAKSMD